MKSFNTPTHEKSSPWMTAAEAAEYLKTATGTIRNWTSQKRIPFARRGRVVRFHRDKLDTWLTRGACHGRATIADKQKTALTDMRSGPTEPPQS
jgi:excisionase family DNA binding protein